VAVGAGLIVAHAKGIVVEAGAFVTGTNVIILEVAMCYKGLRGGLWDVFD
jgi:serine acetyltransferase